MPYLSEDFKQDRSAMKAAIYSRVSTDKQEQENQVQKLMAVANRHEWTVEAVYSDVISGATDKRPELDALMKSVMRREVDVVLVWDISRLGRSLSHLLKLLDAFHTKGVDLFIDQQGIDTTTPYGKMTFQICGAFAEFERSLIQERVKAGLARAVSQGRKLGRPAIAPVTARKVRDLREEGLSFRKIGKKVGISHTAAKRLCAEV